MDDEITDCEDWEYRAEGNLHIIIANRKTRQVLRLLKCPKEKRIYDELPKHEATESELSFVRHVAHPLMRNCKACFPVQQVPVSQEFLKNLSEKVESNRPRFRLHKIIDQCRKFGILMPDFCQVLPPPPLSVGITISVEIKPKQGFILTGDTRCKFSQFQRLKVQSNVYDRESTYCPLDLFSGCKKRMQRAIKALIMHPQNNLRVFKNGNVAYSQELVNEGKPEKANDVFKLSVLSMFLSHVTDCPNTGEQLNKASENFQDLVCSSLLYPVCDQDANAIHVPQHCDKHFVATDIIRKKKCAADSEFIPSRLNGKLCTETRLSSNCTLGLLLLLQKLENRSIEEYHKMHAFLEKHLDLYPDDRELLSLEGPYDAHHWRKLVDEVRDSDAGVGNEDSWMQDISKTASILRKFLIATSFKDCSIIMTFQLKQHEAVTPNHDLPMTIKTRHGQEYWASLALVDSDPKPASRIPEYYQNACLNPCIM